MTLTAEHASGITLERIQQEAHDIAISKGWWIGFRDIPGLLMLIVTELGEAMEHYRDRQEPYLAQANPKHTYPDTSDWCYMKPQQYGPDKPDGFAVELADVIIRVADMADAMGINLSEVVKTKMEYNKSRPHRHGNKLV